MSYTIKSQYRACTTINLVHTHKLRPHPLAYLVMNMEDIAGFNGELLHCARNIGEVASYVRSISQWVVLVTSEGLNERGMLDFSKFLSFLN